MNDTTPTSSQAPAAPKKRGTIIIDSSALHYLMLPSKRSILRQETNDVPRYSDLLIFLSQHGYDIIIPEMVTYECAYFFFNGQNIHNLFDERDPNPFHNHTRAFIREIAAGHYPNIQILPAPRETDSEASKAMRKLHEVYTNAQSRDGKRAAIIKLNHSFAHRDLGEKAAADLVHHKTFTRPIIYLSNDKKSFPLVAKAAPAGIVVGQLSVRGFFDSLRDSGLWTQLGFPESKNLDCFFKDLEKQAEKLSHNSASLITSFDNTGFRSRTDKPFFDSLAGLIEKLEKEEMAATHASTDGAGRSQRFVEKYAKRGAVVPGTPNYSPSNGNDLG